MRVQLPEPPPNQEGLLTSADLRAAGVPAATVTSWLRRGHLRAVHRGVYAPADLPLTPRVVARGATLATGLAAATASYQTAAGVHELGVLARPGPAHVTVPTHVHRRGRPELVVHRDDLAEAEITVLDGGRVTTLTRTIRDLLAGADRLAAVWAGEAALRAKRISEEELDRLVRCSAGHRHGARVRQWRALMEPRSESPLETAIRLLLSDAGLPTPVPQYTVRNDHGDVLARIDLAWPAARLALEADGTEPHGKLKPVYTDRWRTNGLVGWQTVRFTWFDSRRPAYVVATVRAHLAAAA